VLFSGWLAYLALRSRWHGWKLAGALFAVFYGIHTFLNQIETAVFPAVADQMPPGTLTSLFIAGLILAVPFSLLAVWILGRTREGSQAGAMNPRLSMPAAEWIWKLVAAAVLYVIIYLTFGYYIAWRTPGLPEFYGGTDPGTFLGQLGNIVRESAWLPLFQLFRGLVWTVLGCIIIRMHKGSKWETALAVGLTFSIFTSASLMFPNPFMPPYVATSHAIELFWSNLLYGILLTHLMLWRPAAQRPAPKEVSHAR
jgi:hypothetical protein